MSAQHTPGPWSLNTQYADIEVRGPAESGVLVTVMAPWGIAADGPNPQPANARLIAAAPELLEALKELSAMYASTWDRVGGDLVMMGGGIERFEAAHQVARDAIAKAAGALA